MKAGETPPPGVVSVEGVFDVSHGFFIPARACERGRTHERDHVRRAAADGTAAAARTIAATGGRANPGKLYALLYKMRVLFQKISSNFDTKHKHFVSVISARTCAAGRTARRRIIVRALDASNNARPATCPLLAAVVRGLSVC